MCSDNMSDKRQGWGGVLSVSPSTVFQSVLERALKTWKCVTYARSGQYRLQFSHLSRRPIAVFSDLLCASSFHTCSREKSLVLVGGDHVCLVLLAALFDLFLACGALVDE